VTKKEIVKTISEELGLTQLKTKEIVQKTFDAIVEALVDEGRIELRNFGVFEVKKRASRKARNPRTGQRVDVPEKWVVTFKPGKEMEERVRILAEARERRQEAARSMQETVFGSTIGRASAAEPQVGMLGPGMEPETGPIHRPPDSFVSSTVGEVESLPPGPDVNP
jgi:nucleoid DNA-binding protein